MWERERQYQQSVYAELHATLRNTALGLAFKAPDGKHWTRDMFMPGYSSVSDPDEYDWRTERTKMNLIGKRDPQKRREDALAEAAIQASTKDRFRQAEEAKQRGASREEIRLIMEA